MSTIVNLSIQIGLQFFLQKTSLLHEETNDKGQEGPH